ncbi:MAG: PDGLE domain-containing protein [Promethearchaeota archaeon]
MELWLKKSLIVLSIFIAIVPLGILVTWNYNDAWGEWGEVNDESNGIVWTPKSFFKALLPDYNVDGWDSQLMASLGYWISAIVGVSLTFFIVYAIFKLKTLRNEALETNKNINIKQ